MRFHYTDNIRVNEIELVRDLDEGKVYRKPSAETNKRPRGHGENVMCTPEKCVRSTGFS